jgi:hypothetical protein
MRRNVAELASLPPAQPAQLSRQAHVSRRHNLPKKPEIFYSAFTLVLWIRIRIWIQHFK